MIQFILMFLSGIFCKITDDIIDKKLRLKNWVYLFGALYGGLIFVLLINYTILSSLLLGTVIGTVVSKKIDHKAHFFAIVIIFISLFFIDLLKINYVLLVVFSLASLLDEVVSRFYRKKKNIIFKILEYRILLEIIALVVSISVNNYIFFFAILSFDVGYLLIYKVIKSKTI